jgi:hypothetical protein
MRLVRNPWLVFGWTSFVALIAALVGCDLILGNDLNPKYCAAHPDDADCMREMPMGCTTSAQCEAPAGVCLVEERTCVQCTITEASACVGTTPVCGTNNTCGGCSKHSDCASAACLPDGACGSDSNVAYVAPTGTDNDQCTKAAPCTKVAKALATTRPFVKLSGVTDEAVTVEGGRQVSFLAETGAKLTRGSGGAILTVKDTGTSLRVFDLAISDAPNNASGFGVLVPAGSGAPSVSLTRVKLQNNPGGGISASGATVAVAQSTISGNAGGGVLATGGTLTVAQSTISGNQGGGISASNGTFDITNNFIFRNGDSDGGGDFGGVSLSVAAASGNRFEFNTVVDNHAKAGGATVGGIRCDVTGLALANNIISRNDISRNVNAINANILAAGACTYPSSIRDTSLVGLLFVEPEQAPYNYHLAAGSSAIDQATTASTTTVDFDSDARPQGTQKDIGADEHKP